MVRNHNYCVIDVETTGLLDESKAEVVEVGCLVLDCDDLSEVGRFQSLVRPRNLDCNKPIPKWAAGAFKKHKITLDELNNAPDAEEVCNKLIGLFKGKPILVGHNLYGFDIFMLQRLFGSCDLNIDDYTWGPSIDTYTLAYLTYRENRNVKNYKLDTLCNLMDISLKNAHRAMVDVDATAEVFKRFVSAMRVIGTNGALPKVKHKKAKNKAGSTSNYKCPDCKDGYLFLRTNRKSNNKFYGCSGYFDGKCRFTCQVNEVAKYRRKE